jgi:O-antigen/teichoic acid export membrane protein
MKQLSDIKRRSVIGVISYTLRSALLYVVAIAGTALLSAYLTPEEFGVYFIVTALIGLFTFFSDIGLAAALIQKREEPTVQELRTSFTIQQGLAFLIVITTIGLTPVWNSQLNLTAEGIWLLYALSASFLAASFKTIPSILLERKMLFSKLVLPQVAEQVVFYSLAVYLAINGYGITSYTIAVISRSLAGLIVMYSLQRWPIGLALSKKAVSGLLQFGVKFQLNDLLARLKDDLYIVVLARFISQADMGYIGWAKRWSMFPYQFSVQNVTAITFPTFARVQSDLRLVARGLELSIYFIGLTIFPILTGMALLAQPLIQMIPAYQQWQPALPALYLFCINIGLAAIANPFISALNATGHINFTLRLMTVMTVSTWILTALLWPIMGYLAVAFVAALTAALSLLAIFHFRTITSVFWWPQIRIPLLASVFMALIVLLFQSQLPATILGLVFQIIVGAFSYTLCVLLLDKKHLFTSINTLRFKSA